MNKRVSWVLGAALACAACGGKVVFVEDDDGGDGGRDGSGGGRTTNSTTSFMPSTSSGTACDQLEVNLASANAAAAACDPFLNLIQCSGSTAVLDTCGCPSILANETQKGLIDQASVAYEAWVGAGCGPIPCESCTPAFSGFCLDNGDGTGVCTPALTN